MTQSSIFDQPQFPRNAFKPKSQNFRLYERLLRGPVTNATIIREYGIFNSTGRISEVREYLKPHGIKLHCERLRDGLYEYRIGS